MKKIILVFTFFFTALSVYAGFFDRKSPFLPAQEAFVLSFQLQDNHLVLHWDIATGYYLYQKNIRLEQNGQPIHFSLPLAQHHKDEFFGTNAVYFDKLDLAIDVNRLNNAPLHIHYQGCTAGFCYPPEMKEISIELIRSVDTSEHLQNGEKTSTDSTALFTQDNLKPSLSFFTLSVFFVFGLGLALTPCVLPMLPLLSAFVIGTTQRPTIIKSLGLSFVYVQGMALTYTLLGLLVASLGLPFQTALQSPPVLIILSVFFVLLALPMFGVYQFQLPVSLQTVLTRLSQKQKNGTFRGGFTMGMLAGLIASPCTTAPLSSILLYVAQSGDLFLGGFSLYVLAMGMGIPLILVTVFGNQILPKSGEWLNRIKQIFGFVILSMPVFLLSRILPDIWEKALWSILLTAFFLHTAFQMQKHGMQFVIKLCFLIAAFIAIKPIQDIFWKNSEEQLPHFSTLSMFRSIQNDAQLQAALHSTSKSITMLDLYADWCVACKDFEKYTFQDEQVKKALNDMQLLRIDVSKNSPENTALLKELNIVGLPAVIFFDKQGNEITQSRIHGFMPAKEFLKQLNTLATMKH